jgi:L-alanine-DL-glutamate epimerase-like enolase superfamily enzyme
MKIERFEVLGVRVNHGGDWLFVRLETDAGHVGLGEVSHSGSGVTLA